MEYLLHILVLAGIYVVLAISLDLLAGHTGILSIAQAGFFGVGAYTSVLLTLHFGVQFVLATLAAMAVAILVSIIVSVPSLRLHDDYFVIATFGFQIILSSVFNNWINVTRGPLGIHNIPQPMVFGVVINSTFRFFILTLIIAAIAYWLVGRINSSPFGRVLRAIREDEVFTESLGKATLKYKVSAFAISAALTACAGSAYASYIAYVDPTNFTVMESVLVISMVIIGGAGSRWGPLIGAFILVALPEALRFVGLPSSIAPNIRQMIYGTLLVIMLLMRPRGLVGKYGFGR